MMDKTGTPIGSYAPDFELPGVDEVVHHLARYLERFQAVGVVFLGNHCSWVQAYLPRLRAIQEQFQDQSFTLIGINANDASQSPEDSFEQMKVFARDRALNFPYLRDVTQDVARSFGVVYTPAAFLLDHEGILRYRGAIDDSPTHPDQVQTPYFQQAIAQLLAGSAITPDQTEVKGQPVKWRT